MLLLLLACTPKDDVDTATPGTTLALLDEYLVAGDDAFPESVAWDPVTAAFYTSSLGRGDVSKTLSTGETSTFYAGDDTLPWVTIGLEVDTTRRRLWVCASTFDGSAPGELWVFDLDGGTEIATLSLGDARGDASCTDVRIASDGVAYVTDRENPDIYRVDLDAGTAEIWLEDPILEPDVIGLNGIVFTPDGEHLLVTKYLSAELLRIPVADPAGAEAVTLGGDAFAGAGLNGADDIVFVGETLYATLVDRVLALTSSDGSWASAEVTTTDIVVAGVTGLAVAEGELFGSNGQAVEFTFGTAPTTPFWVHRLE